MIKKIKTKIGLYQKIAVIGIVNHKNYQEYIYAIIAKVKNELQIITFKKNIKNIDQLSEIDKSIPIIIAFTGQGIVTTSNANNLIFNDNANEYYVTKYLNSNKKNFTSFTRKNTIDKLLLFFSKNNNFIVDITIGTFSINLLYKKIFESKKIQIYDIILNYDNEDFINYEKTIPNLNSKINLENTDKDSFEIYLLAIGFNYFFPSDKLINQFENQNIQQDKIEYNYKKQYDLIIKIGSLIFVIILFFNFIFNTFLNHKNNKMLYQLNKTAQYQNKLKFLKNEISKKNTVIKMARFLNPNYLSFYINEIGSMIPNEISLTELNILPIKNNIKNEKKIEIDNGKIIISGITNSNNSFNILLETIRKKDWVKKIEILTFKENKDYKSNFKLEIYLK